MLFWDGAGSFRPNAVNFVNSVENPFSQESHGHFKKPTHGEWIFVVHNREWGQARDGETEGRLEGRDERDRASQIKRILRHGERLCRRISMFVSFVFVREIGGSNIQHMNIKAGWVTRSPRRIRFFEALA